VVVVVSAAVELVDVSAAVMLGPAVVVDEPSSPEQAATTSAAAIDIAAMDRDVQNRIMCGSPLLVHRGT
jgi:hypothetical protein